MHDNHTNGEMYQPTVGDRVRVTLEGEVTYATAPGDFDLGPLASVFKVGATTSDRVVSVEKIKPPVETFQPGDVVRETESPDHIFTLSHTGYTRLHPLRGVFFLYAGSALARKAAYPELPSGSIARSEFTSKKYERVVI